MSNFMHAHKDRLSHCVLVFGAAGLLFYAALFIANLLLKFSLQLFAILKGIGL